MARQIVFKFPLTHGLHARPASLIQEISQRFKATVSLVNERTHNSADGKSILSLIAAETRKNDPCRFIIEGSDEVEAEKALKTLLAKDLPGCEEELPDTQFSSASKHKIPHLVKKEKSLYFTGTGVCGGINRAAVVILDAFHLEAPEDNKEFSENRQMEIQAVHNALKRQALELTDSIQGTAAANPIEKDILNAHLAIIQDKKYLETIENFINERHYTAVKAVFETARYFAGILQKSKSYYLRQRLADIKDISTQVMASLTGANQSVSQGSQGRQAGTGGGIYLNKPAILVAEDILPSRFISLDKKYVKGLILSEAGSASHSVILARTFNIPTIIGIKDIFKNLNQGETIIIDAERGLVIPSPNETLSHFYDLEMAKHQQKKDRVALYIPGPGVTADGKRMEVAANIGSPAELESAFLNGAEGIGLFRTEWLFMNRPHAPTEEEQFQIYAQAAAAAGKRPVIIRTIDIGGDKPIPYLDLPQEPNPFLGNRAIRIYDVYPDLINQQLRAILRASTSGNLKIMFPMVCCLEEILALKKRLKSIMQELAQERLPFNPEIPIGIMVEIPAAAFAAADMSPEVDFFSIGSNDLAQYFLAADRGNPRLSHIYNTLYPSFLRLLEKISTEVHNRGKWLGLCGELAGKVEYLPLWLGLGFDEISMASPSIPAIKSSLRELTYANCEKIAVQLLKTTTAQQLQEQLKDFFYFKTETALITEELINLASSSSSRDEAVRELVNLLDLSARIEDSDDVEELIWQREEAYSTGIGFGIAIPHCNGAQVKHNSIAFLKLKKPIDWQSLDNQPVDMVFLLAIQAAQQDNKHLHILSRLSRNLMDEEFVAKLREAAKPVDIISLIKNSVT